MIGYLMAHAVQKTQPAVALALPDLLLYFHKTFLPFFVTFFLTFFLSYRPFETTCTQRLLTPAGRPSTT